VPSFLRDDVGGHLTIVPLDVRDRTATLALGESHAITSVVDLAGAWPTNPMDELRDASNGLANVLDAALAWKAKRVLVASTLGIYGRPSPGASVREDAIIPHVGSAHPIQAAKKIAEIFAEQVSQRTSIECVSVRIAAIYGPGNRGLRSFPAVMTHAIAKRIPMDLGRLAWGSAPDDGFDYTYVKDCAEALALLATAPSLRHRMYNVGSGAGTTNRDFVTAARKLAPQADLGLPGAFYDRTEAPPGASLNLARLKEDTGYAPRFDVVDGVSDYLAWLSAGNAE
jgi:UDP-glucose 4-epimerase